jgi:hypothetical protein
VECGRGFVRGGQERLGVGAVWKWFMRDSDHIAQGFGGKSHLSSGLRKVEVGEDWSSTC